MWRGMDALLTGVTEAKGTCQVVISLLKGGWSLPVSKIVFCRKNCEKFCQKWVAWLIFSHLKSIYHKIPCNLLHALLILMLFFLLFLCCFSGSNSTQVQLSSIMGVLWGASNPFQLANVPPPELSLKGVHIRTSYNRCAQKT